MISSLIGRVLQGVHAGEKHLLTHEDKVASTPQIIDVRSAAFENDGAIPQRYAGEGVGDDVSPPLAWSGVPEGTGGLLLMVQDPAAPLPRPIVHCLATMTPDVREIPEGGLKDGSAPAGVTLWKGTMGDVGYIGPKPVPGHGVHNLCVPGRRPDDSACLRRHTVVWGTVEGHRGAGARMGTSRRDLRAPLDSYTIDSYTRRRGVCHGA